MVSQTEFNLDYPQETFSRTDALASQDATRYASLCSLEGIEPEDQFLHERGKLELSLRPIAQELEQEKQKSKRIIAFLQLGGTLQESSFKQSRRKKELLQKYFPERFNPKGTQDISKYRKAQVGNLFNRIWDFYHPKYIH